MVLATVRWTKRGRPARRGGGRKARQGWKVAGDSRGRRSLTGTRAGSGQIEYEVLEGPVFGWVEVVTGRVLHIQPLPVAVGPPVVLVQEHAHQQQQTQQEQRPRDHGDQFHQPPRPAGAVASTEPRLRHNCEGDREGARNTRIN